MESISVMIIIAILIVLGIVFGFNQRTADLKIQRTEIKEIDATGIALKAGGLKEIKCSSAVDSGAVCFDYYRLKAISEISIPDEPEYYEYYYGLFKKSQITVNMIYPDADAETITMYEYADSTDQNVSTSYFPVIVYEPVTKKNVFSIMEIRVYS